VLTKVHTVLTKVHTVLTKVHTVLTKVHSFYNAFCNKMILFEFKNIQQVFKM